MKKKTTYVYQGKIWSGEFRENYDALMVGYNVKPLSYRVEQDLGWGSKEASVRYWITDQEKTKEELVENEMLKNAGALTASYNDHYSDLTGYLWTDENLKTGGHDLMKELFSHKGKFVYLEIDVL